jgi:hypothetical protein
MDSYSMLWQAYLSMAARKASGNRYSVPLGGIAQQVSKTMRTAARTHDPSSPASHMSGQGGKG